MDSHPEFFEPYEFRGTLTPPHSPSDEELPFSDIPTYFDYEPGFPLEVTSFTSKQHIEDYKNRGGENPCVHYNDWIEREPWLRHGNSANRNMRAGLATSAYQYLLKNPFGFMGENTTPRGTLPEMPADIPFPDISGDAFVSMYPEVETEVSLVNFIYELKDLRKLASTLNSVKRVWNLLLGRGKPTYKMGDITDVYLANEFGVQPLVSDIRSIIGSAQNIQTKFLKYFGDQNKVLRRHYTRRYHPDSVPWSLSSEFDTPYGSPTTHRGKHTCGVPEVTYTATMVYSYSLPGLGPLSGHALTDVYRELYLLDLYGVQLNPRIIWDAIPFSFVVDYFVRVGDWLDQFKKRNLNPDVVVWEWIESIRYTVRRNHWVKPWNLDKNGWCYCGSMNREVYIRRRHVPNTHAAVQSLGLTGRQIINMCALVGARARGRNIAKTH